VATSRSQSPGDLVKASGGPIDHELFHRCVAKRPGNRLRRQLAERNPELVRQMTHHLRGGHAPPAALRIRMQRTYPALKQGADIGVKH
jgi:hypothetical protein